MALAKTEDPSGPICPGFRILRRSEHPSACNSPCSLPGIPEDRDRNGHGLRDSRGGNRSAPKGGVPPSGFTPGAAAESAQRRHVRHLPAQSHPKRLSPGKCAGRGESSPNTLYSRIRRMTGSPTPFAPRSRASPGSRKREGTEGAPQEDSTGIETPSKRSMLKKGWPR